MDCDERENEEMELPLFNFGTIANATNNFSIENLLGKGGFGSVYKGTLAEGQHIAVKRLSNDSGQGLKEFKNEVILIAKLQHRNLVKLLGCCIQGDEKLLIYEYMANKSLDYFIFGLVLHYSFHISKSFFSDTFSLRILLVVWLTWGTESDRTRSKLLDWSKRVNIIGGIARGLLYLHQDSRLRIIHRDLKSSNILLDNAMNPKISDFGLAKTFWGDQTEANTNKVVGTYGYMSPEYAIDGVFSMKSDVFSFGVLVLEIVSGKKNRGFSHPDHDHNLLGHAWRLWTEKRPMELIDDAFGDFCLPSEMLRCIHVGLLCVQQRPEDRPNMSSVIVMLGSESALPQPKQPGFFTGRNLPEAESSTSNCKSSSANECTVTLLEPR
ncbi:Serine-threonine/tyrosine-protein kinase [Theobroma cacao]|nr:Serine-threonine/tyrosine-protein kinase [Theobroma cacao]